ncbi:MAG: hypothetical protein ACXVMS_15590 [Flavisolibacter sp.]
MNLLMGTFSRLVNTGILLLRCTQHFLMGGILSLPFNDLLPAPGFFGTYAIQSGCFDGGKGQAIKTTQNLVYGNRGSF